MKVCKVFVGEKLKKEKEIKKEIKKEIRKNVC